MAFIYVERMEGVRFSIDLVIESMPQFDMGSYSALIVGGRSWPGI